jgi:hypothetical protein
MKNKLFLKIFVGFLLKFSLTLFLLRFVSRKFILFVVYPDNRKTIEFYLRKNKQGLWEKLRKWKIPFPIGTLRIKGKIKGMVVGLPILAEELSSELPKYEKLLRKWTRLNLVLGGRLPTIALKLNLPYVKERAKNTIENSAKAVIACIKILNPPPKSLGIVGIGSVGKKVVEFLANSHNFDLKEVEKFVIIDRNLRVKRKEGKFLWSFAPESIKQEMIETVLLLTTSGEINFPLETVKRIIDFTYPSLGRKIINEIKTKHRNIEIYRGMLSSPDFAIQPPLPGYPEIPSCLLVGLSHFNIEIKPHLQAL